MIETHNWEYKSSFEGGGGDGFISHNCEFISHNSEKKSLNCELISRSSYFISQNCDFISHYDFLTSICEFISRNSEKKSQNCEKKVAITFLMFYSEAETGFHIGGNKPLLSKTLKQS